MNIKIKSIVLINESFLEKMFNFLFFFFFLIFYLKFFNLKKMEFFQNPTTNTNIY